jgi:hypothetical protein
MMNRISHLVALIGMFSAFCSVSGVVIFCFYVMPEIEKRLKRKLDYVSNPYRVAYVTTKFGPIAKIMECYYIIVKYLMYKKNKKTSLNESKFDKYCSAVFALATPEYKIEEATKLEIFISFFTVISALMFFILGGILYLMKKYS